ncbi:MAG: hypothetical protein V9G15_04480 [Dermatophilaceae bacterium]|nr:hypothetical protein [Dermatophilaceae bacterium]
MGLFWTGVFDGTAWTVLTDDDEGSAQASPQALPPGALVVTIHDSDIGSVSYAPVEGDGDGDSDGGDRTAFVGFTPRSYFEDDAAPSADPDVEARGLAAWAGRYRGVTPTAEQVRALLAADGDEFDESDDPFVESKVAKLLGVLGVPVPEDLGGWGVDGLDSTERSWDR